MPERDLPHSPQLIADHALLCAAVRDAGALALGYFQTDLKHWDKGKDDPVSEADHAVNDLLHARLQGTRPDYGWLSEETEDDPTRLTCDHVWVIDPIDGTRAFIKGKPHFTICAALVQKGAPVCAAVFNPATEMEMVDRNSVAYRLVLVANGYVDACLALNRKNDWDLAAADLIVREAGGRITTHDGATLVYNKPFTKHRSLLAAGPNLYNVLFDKVGQITLP